MPVTSLSLSLSLSLSFQFYGNLKYIYPVNKTGCMSLFRSKKKLPEDDVAIIAAYKASGEQQYVGMLFEKYAHLVYGVCFHYLKDSDKCSDAVMNIFEKLFSDLKKYEIQNFSSWLHTTARNYCFALLKKEVHHVELNDKVNGENLDITEENDSDAEFISKHIDYLQEAIHAIKAEQKICISMFYLENKSYDEISAVTGFDYKQVKSYIQNGKRNLKIYLTEKSEKKLK